MIYRDAGQFKTSYAADQAIFPIMQDRGLLAILMIIAIVIIPLFASEYWLNTIMIPFLVFSLAALGLNILTGYAGQLSLGTGGFMACGAFAAYKLCTSFPDMNIVLVLLISGLISAGVGILFGLPSLRIKGFYLAVATLASQFFLIWMFNKFGWFTNYSSSGVISAPPRDVFGTIVDRFRSDANSEIFICISDRGNLGAASQKHGAWQYRTRMDGDSGYGYCG